MTSLARLPRRVGRVDIPGFAPLAKEGRCRLTELVALLRPIEAQRQPLVIAEKEDGAKLSVALPVDVPAIFHGVKTRLDLVHIRVVGLNALAELVDPLAGLLVRRPKTTLQSVNAAFKLLYPTTVEVNVNVRRPGGSLQGLDALADLAFLRCLNARVDFMDPLAGVPDAIVRRPKTCLHFRCPGVYYRHSRNNAAAKPRNAAAKPRKSLTRKSERRCFRDGVGLFGQCVERGRIMHAGAFHSFVGLRVAPGGHIPPDVRTVSHAAGKG